MKNSRIIMGLSALVLSTAGAIAGAFSNTSPQIQGCTARLQSNPIMVSDTCLTGGVSCTNGAGVKLYTCNQGITSLRHPEP